MSLHITTAVGICTEYTTEWRHWPFWSTRTFIDHINSSKLLYEFI